MIVYMHKSCSKSGNFWESSYENQHHLAFYSGHVWTVEIGDIIILRTKTGIPKGKDIIAFSNEGG